MCLITSLINGRLKIEDNESGVYGKEIKFLLLEYEQIINVQESASLTYSLIRYV